MFSTKNLALVAVFAAIYIGYGYISSVFFRQFTRSLDLFFLIAVFFTILAMVVEWTGAATLLGLTTGIIFFGTPAPAAQHIAASLVANGLVFDLYLRVVNRHKPPWRIHLVVAAALGNLAMAIVGLLALQASGLVLPSTVWVVAVVGDPLVGAAGAVFGLTIARRIQAPAVLTRRT